MFLSWGEKMTDEQEKDNTWIWAGFAVACIILLIVLLKKDETKHLQSGAVAASNAEIDKELVYKHELESETPEAPNNNPIKITSKETK